MQRRILLLYISEVSGHHSATLAIEKALKLLDKNIITLNLNGFSYTTPTSEKLVNRLYMGVIKKLPWIWDYLYDNIEVKKRIDNLKDFVHKINRPKLKILFESFLPQVVICSQAYPCGMVADYKKYYKEDFKLIAVLTDYIPHSYWIYDTIDYYIAPSQEVKEKLIEKGVEEYKIKVFGIPIDPKFIQEIPKEEIIKKFNLKSNLPTILIMGGGQGLGPIKMIVKRLDNLDIELQMLVVTGINRKLYNFLNREKFRKKALIFSFINNIEELMSIADLIITKPGGITTAEALSKGLPMIIVEPLPGQERSNTDYLIDKKVALIAKRASFIDKIVKELLLEREKLVSMSEAAKILSKPYSAFEIAELAINLCNNVNI